MKSIILRLITALAVSAIFISGGALAGNELVMQKVTSSDTIQLASGSHNPCGHDDEHKKSKSKKHGKDHKNACNPCGDSNNPCGKNPCASNPCDHTALDDNSLSLAAR